MTKIDHPQTINWSLKPSPNGSFCPDCPTQTWLAGQFPMIFPAINIRWVRGFPRFQKGRSRSHLNPIKISYWCFPFNPYWHQRVPNPHLPVSPRLAAPHSEPRRSERLWPSQRASSAALRRCVAARCGASPEIGHPHVGNLYKWDKYGHPCLVIGCYMIIYYHGIQVWQLCDK